MRQLSFTSLGVVVILSTTVSVAPSLPWDASGAPGTVNIGSSGPEPSQVATFREVAVGRIRAGSALDEIDLVDCEDCGEGCTGAAFLAADRTVYFYEDRRNNLKVLCPGAADVVVIPGPELVARNARPVDGVAVADGTVYLLADRGTTKNRYRIYCRPLRAPGWTVAEPLDDADIGWLQIGGRRVAGHGAVRIAASPWGQVEVFDFDRRFSSAVVVGDSSGLRASRARTNLPPGAMGQLNHTVRGEGHATTIVGADVARSLEVPGVFLGMDAHDNLHFRVPGPADGVDLLRRYGPDGRLLAQGTVPARPIVAILKGKGTFQLASNGDIFQFRMTPEGLEVTRWTTEP